MRSQNAFIQRKPHEAFRCGICFALCALLGSAGGVSANLPCDAFARTNLEILSVEKAGVAQSLPSKWAFSIHTSSPSAIVYDPDTGMSRRIPLEVSK